MQRIQWGNIKNVIQRGQLIFHLGATFRILTNNMGKILETNSSFHMKKCTTGKKSIALSSVVC